MLSRQDGKLVRSGGKLSRCCCGCTNVANYHAQVRIQLVDCVISCHPSENYNISQDFTSEVVLLKFPSNTNCLVQKYQWCCGDPAQDDPPSNQGCVWSELSGCDAPIGDVVIATHGYDPPYPDPCVPVDRGNWNVIFQYYVNEWIRYAVDGNFYIRIIPPPGTEPEQPPAGTLPTDPTYWRQLIDESPPSFGLGCSGLVSYSGSMGLILSFFEAEWYLSFGYSLANRICGASTDAVYGIDFPINDNLGGSPVGTHHYESGLGGTPTPPGNLIADIEIT